MLQILHFFPALNHQMPYFGTLIELQILSSGFSFLEFVHRDAFSPKLCVSMTFFYSALRGLIVHEDIPNIIYQISPTQTRLKIQLTLCLFLALL
jgi:hypothetical protein